MIVVSGATGFLGAHTVCYLLQQGKRVKALKRAQSELNEFNYIFSLYFGDLSDPERGEMVKQIQWVEADILDIASLETALEQATEVYHCAAVVSFMKKYKEQMMQVNVEGTANMVNISLIKGVQRFCHVSSIAALGRTKHGLQVDEHSKWENSVFNSNYAISKYKAEMEVWRGMEEGLNAVIVNPGVILGAGSWQKGSCKLFELPWKNFPFYTEGVNGYVDVKDVARSMYNLMGNKERFGERYVLVSENVSMKYFMHHVADQYAKAKASIRVNRWMAELAWILFALKSIVSGKDATITKETSRASLRSFYYSSDKIRQTGFIFTPITETLDYISQQFKQYHQS